MRIKTVSSTRPKSAFPHTALKSSQQIMACYINSREPWWSTSLSYMQITDWMAGCTKMCSGQGKKASVILQTTQGLMKTGMCLCHIRALSAQSQSLNPCLSTPSYCSGSVQLHTEFPWATAIDQEAQINSPGCANTGRSQAPSGRNLTAHVNTHHPQSYTTTPGKMRRANYHSSQGDLNLSPPPK